MPLVIGGIY